MAVCSCISKNSKKKCNLAHTKKKKNWRANNCIKISKPARWHSESLVSSYIPNTCKMSLGVNVYVLDVL